MSLLWINGHLIDKADARVSPFDHGFLYGDGVWEPLRVFGGNLFRPHEHLGHLFVAADVLGIDIPLSREELLAAIEATVRANNRTEGYVRVIVSRGPGTIGPDPRKIDPQVFIIAEEYHPFPAELYDHGLHARVAAAHLNTDDQLQRVRTLGQPHVVQAKSEALRAGCLEALLLNTSNELVAATEGRLLVVRSGEVIPITQEGVGVTQMVAVGLLTAAGQPVAGGRRLGYDELFGADEIILAGTSCGVIGIASVDGQDIGGGTEGPVTRQIRERYRALTRGG
jgi:branched-chain amino acid aminotransferase